MDKFQHFIGQDFDRLHIIDIFRKSDKKGIFCHCKCSCGNPEIVTVSLYRMQTKQTRSCGCLHKELLRKLNSKIKWQGIGDMGKSVICNIIHKAKHRKVDFGVSIEFLWNLFLKQNKKCRFTGVELCFSRTHNITSKTASLDRIDSSKGYTEDNVQWVHKVINKMKLNMTDQEFIQWCTLVVDHNRESALDNSTKGG